MLERDDWDSHWQHYAAAAKRNPAQQMRHALITRLLGQGVGADGSGTRILDIGSGQGDLIVQLRRALPAAEFRGMELSASGVEISRNKVPSAHFVVADLFQPPAELAAWTGWATGAACSEVLEHVDDPAEFLRRARVYLGKGARLVVTVPGGPMSAFDRTIGHRQHFTRASLRHTIEAAGLVVDRVYLSGFPFFNLYRLLVILRGDQLAADLTGKPTSFSARLAAGAMSLFRGLFRWNLMDSPFGWQVVATARLPN
jgi:SAM-dependent methyltransferase